MSRNLPLSAKGVSFVLMDSNGNLMMFMQVRLLSGRTPMKQRHAGPDRGLL